MTAAMLVLEPILRSRPSTRAIFPIAPGATPNRRWVEVEALLFRGGTTRQASTSDPSRTTFGRSPMRSYCSRSAPIVDLRVLHLIKICWNALVGRNRRSRTADTPHDGSPGQPVRLPQGSPLSTVRAKSVHAPCSCWMENAGLERSLGTRIVTYADDLGSCCRKCNAARLCNDCAISWALTGGIGDKTSLIACSERCGGRPYCR